MYNPRHIIDILAGNVRQTGSPFAVPKGMANGWWKGLDLPSTGGAMLFTGLMYQFVPYIETATRQMERYEDTPWASYLPYARFIPPLLSGLGLELLTPKEVKQRAHKHLHNIVKILRKYGTPFSYRPDLDEYSGILLYDLGDQESFVRHARRVADKLRQAGVTELITTDPHTTYALKILYPKHVGATFTVRTYFEVLDLPAGSEGDRLTLHDPCFYGRYLELSDIPRAALQRLGHECVDTRECGPFTSCCGGPAESISPKLSAEIGARRADRLSGAGGKIVTMCPICLNNLERSGANVVDLSTVLARNA